MTMWLPPSAREVELQVEPLAEDDYGRVLGPDSATFLHAHDFGYITVERGEVPSVSIEFRPLREGILNGVSKVEMFGITEGMTTATGELVPWPEGQRTAYVRLSAYHVHVFVGDAPADWMARAVIDGFAIACLPFYDDGTIPFLATGPMTFGAMAIAGSSRGEKVGRNEPCPCGSGLKSKRCCNP